jgi:signal transduction histidine kinase/ActR/RegA family two-component response regulator
MSFTALIADDDAGFCRAFQAYFSDWDVEVAEDGEVATHKLKAKTFDVVVLDRDMPKMGGDAVLRWMSTRAELQHTCTIMCTAFGETSKAVDALKLGAWNYVLKPVRDLELVKALILPGIALKRCNRARSELFTSQDLPSLFEKILSVCGYAVAPAGGMHLLLMSPDGEILHAAGDLATSSRKRRHKFVDKVIQQGDAWLFAETAQETAALEPILPDSKTLAAVAVRGFGTQVLGVLDLEASSEHAFGVAWQEVLRYVADLVAMHRLNEIYTQQLASAAIYREIRHRIATHAQVVSMQTSDLLSANLGPSLDARRLRVIKRNADTIDSIVRGLRDIAQERVPELTPGHSVSALLAEAAEQSAAKHAQNHEPQTTCALCQPLFDCLICANASELKYTLECILDNAWEAIAERYRQDPDCKEGWAGNIKIAIEPEGHGVSLVISDNGIGFEPREKDLLFSPLYSTKTRMREGKENEPDAKGVERVTRVLTSVGWALSIDQEAEKALGDHDLKGAEINIRDENARATVAIRHPSLQNGGITVSQAIVTSGSDENRGIGLFSARQTIRQHGGLIQADSSGVFQGATFKIWLPAEA